MNGIMSILAWICLVWASVQFQFLVYGPAKSFARRTFVCRLRRHAVTLPFILERTFPSLISSSVCEAVMAGMDWAADNFVWVCLPNERFHLGDSSSVPVGANPPNRGCYHLLWCAEFPVRQSYRGTWAGLKWAMVPMAPVTGGYNFHHAESDLVGLPPQLLSFNRGSAADWNHLDSAEQLIVVVQTRMELLGHKSCRHGWHYLVRGMELRRLSASLLYASQIAPSIIKYSRSCFVVDLVRLIVAPQRIRQSQLNWLEHWMPSLKL